MPIAPPITDPTQQQTGMLPFGGALEPLDSAPSEAPMIQPAPAQAESVLGSEVPAGQQIPEKKMAKAEHLAANPEAETAFRHQQDYHDIEKHFGDMSKAHSLAAAANADALGNLKIDDPDYVNKMMRLNQNAAAIRMSHGELKSAKADYDRMHPWGTPESAHPGVLGKIGHVASEIGQVAGSAVAPAVVASIPGTQANLAGKERAGQAETELGTKETEQGVQTAHTAAEIPEVEAGTEHTKQETENLKNPPEKVGATPEETTIHDLMTGDNGNPRINPVTNEPFTYLDAYKQVKETAEGAKPEKAKSPEEQFIEDYFKRNPDKTMADAVKAYADASQKPERPGAGSARGDKSYQYNQGRLDKIRQPIDQLMQRFGRLQDTLAQGNPQSDALLGPELLTIMAGGQGSGLRMNEAEIARIVGGRSAWENLKASINHWSTNPNEARSITSDQDRMIRALVKTVGDKLTAKQKIAEGAQERLLDTDDPHEHRKIMADFQKKVDAVDAGQNINTAQPNGAPNAPTVGTIENGHRFKGGDPSKKENWERVQ